MSDQPPKPHSFYLPIRESTHYSRLNTAAGAWLEAALRKLEVKARK